MSNQSIIVVDDDPVVHHILKSILSNLGYNVLAFNTGLDCKSHLDKNTLPYALFVDLYLEDCTGFELVEDLKKQFPNFDCPVILLSANTEEEVMQVPGAFVSDFFLQKPFTAEQVSEALEITKRTTT